MPIAPRPRSADGLGQQGARARARKSGCGAMIPLVDLAAQYRLLKSDIDAAIEVVLRDGKYVLAPAVDSFEHDFAQYCGTSHAVGTNSGTSALHVALLAAGVRPGDEVITVPFTFIATVAAIEYAGAKPVLVDIDRDYYTM